jgi:hypothetical protein
MKEQNKDLQNHNKTSSCYGCEAWMISSKSEEMLDAFERKILR